MSYLWTTVLLSSGVVFFMGWHGVTGAIIWGVNILLLDFFGQWLRWRRVMKKANPQGGMAKISLGFFIRLVNVLLLLRIGQAWFLPKPFIICVAITLATPLTSICGAYMLMQRGFK
jgi:hypothetical protein